MKKLVDMIDAFVLKSLPMKYSSDECRLAVALIENAREQIRPYSGDFRAAWLLNDFDSPVWITINQGREEFVNGKWEHACRANWDVLLPNGHYLTDQKYSKLLATMKKIAFLARSGFLGMNPTVSHWKDIVNMLISLARWVVMHEHRYVAAEFAFGQVDKIALNSLFASLAAGGWVEVFQIPYRLISLWYEKATGRPVPEDILRDPYNLPDQIQLDLADWLRINDYFIPIESGTYKGRQYLSRVKLGRDVSESARRMLASTRMAIFCRQFETDFLDTPLIVSGGQITEFPSHKTQTIEEAKSQPHSEVSLDSIAHLIKVIFSARKHIGDLLPHPQTVDVMEAKNINQGHTRPAGHNRFIPIDIGLSYLKKSTTIIHEYGQAIIDCYLIITEQIYPSLPKERLGRGKSIRHLTIELSQYESCLPAESLAKLRELGIFLFHRAYGSASFDKLRTAPTLEEMLRVLVGACIGCIGFMKTSRESELTHLARNCLQHGKRGYYIEFQLGKSNVGEAYQDEVRPIPFITAKAIQLLQHLGSSLARIFKDNRKTAHYLFYLPKFEGTGPLRPTPSLLSDHLDVFCDYVGLATDQLGRRWYLRIHEMRKWFLLLLFWSGRYDTLDAARYIAGHRDTEHTYAYIAGDFPGQELPRLEAEYAIDRLLALDTNSPDASHDLGLDLLYQEVLAHFRVNSLSLIKEPDWSNYVTMLREEEHFHLEPHSIYSDDRRQIVGINVAFVLREDER